MDKILKIKVYGYKNNPECYKVKDYFQSLQKYYNEQKFQNKDEQKQIPYIQQEIFLYENVDKLDEIEQNFEYEFVESMNKFKENEKKKKIKEEFIFVLVDESFLVFDLNQAKELLIEQNFGSIMKEFQFNEQSLDTYGKELKTILVQEEFVSEQLKYQKEIEARILKEHDLTNSIIFRLQKQASMLSLDQLMEKTEYLIENSQLKEANALIHSQIKQKTEQENNQYKKWSYELQTSYLMGKIERMQENFDKSEEFILYCLEQYKDIIGEGGIIWFKFNEEYVKLLTQRGQYQKAQELLDQLRYLQGHQFANDARIKVGIMVDQGNVWAGQGKIQESKQLFQECQKLCTEHNIKEFYTVPQAIQ